MTTLKEVNTGFNQFCGPAVLSSLTGKSVDECASVISSITRRMEIRAVKMDDMIKALNKLRFDVTLLDVMGYSLYGVLTSLTEGVYIITVPKHVVAVEVKDKKIYFVDNHTKIVIDAAASARLMQRVENVWKVTEQPQPILVVSEILIRRDSDCRFTIKYHDIYENPEDNISGVIGYISARSEKELLNVLTKLVESS